MRRLHGPTAIVALGILLCLTLTAQIQVFPLGIVNRGEISADTPISSLKSAHTAIANGKSPSELTEVGPILIENASSWANYPFITGDGSNSTPYLIQNVKIVGDDPSSPGNYSGFGIKIIPDAAFIIANCEISQFNIGIYLGSLISNSPDNITATSISDCNLGISTLGDSHWITGNTITRCHTAPGNILMLGAYGYISGEADYGGVGIYVSFTGMGQVFIESNTISSCDVGIRAQSIAHIRQNTLTLCGIVYGRARLFTYEYSSNSINGLPLGVFFQKEGTEESPYIIDGDAQQYGQLIVLGCNHIVIKNLAISNTTLGYCLAANHNLTIENVKAEGCLIGMYLHQQFPLAPESRDTLAGGGLSFHNCGYGLQTFISGSNEENSVIEFALKITELEGNSHDIMPIRLSSMFPITAPAGVRVYLNYPVPFNVVVWHAGTLCDCVQEEEPYIVLNNIQYSAYEATLSNSGNYTILGNTTNNLSEFDRPYLNFSITVVEQVSGPFSIPGFPGLWWRASFAAGIVLIGGIWTRKRTG